MSGDLYLFAGGGTGGHLFPGIAVAQTLLRRSPNSDVLFVGSDRPLERKILGQAGFAYRSLPSARLADARRHPLMFARRIWRARREAQRLLDDVQPSVMIGCGGFASAAPVYAAFRREIPVVLLEQNVIPGRANRWLSRMGGTICLTFEESASRLSRSAKTIVTGNPVRQSIAEIAKSERGSRSTLRQMLVLGGSQGAKSLNDRVLSFSRRHASVLDDWQIVHQTGADDAVRAREVYGSLGIRATVEPFFDDMVARYGEASLIVSRAGGTSLAEIACAGLPAVLLPYPHASEDHQIRNAEPFVSAGAARLVRDSADSGTQTRLDEILCHVLTDDRERDRMASAMSGLARPDAADCVADVILGRDGPAD